MTPPPPSNESRGKILREKMRMFLDSHCLLAGGEIKLSGGGASSFYLTASGRL